MLVLSRKVNEEIVIDGQIRITIVSIKGNQVRLGFNAPEGVKILRQELMPEGASCVHPETGDRQSAECHAK